MLTRLMSWSAEVKANGEAPSGTQAKASESLPKQTLGVSARDDKNALQSGPLNAWLGTPVYFDLMDPCMALTSCGTTLIYIGLTPRACGLPI